MRAVQLLLASKTSESRSRGRTYTVTMTLDRGSDDYDYDKADKELYKVGFRRAKRSNTYRLKQWARTEAFAGVLAKRKVEKALNRANVAAGVGLYMNNWQKEFDFHPVNRPKNLKAALAEGYLSLRKSGEYDLAEDVLEILERL